MKILVTGATGFIGRHLTAALSKSYSVRCLVRKSSDTSVLRNLNAEIVYADLLDKNSLGPVLYEIDLVYHLAGEVHSLRIDDYYKGNVLATQNLLEACGREGFKRIIFLSSVAVYKPVSGKILLTENSECGPITIYGKTKLEAEDLIKKHKNPCVIVRAPVTYGPHQPAVLNRFFLDAFKKRKLYIVGNGDNLRSLCFVDNLVAGLVLLTNKASSNGNTYILSDYSPYTFNEIIETGAKVINQRIGVVHLPNFLGHISWKIYRLMDNVFDLCPEKLYAIKKMQLHEGCDITKARKQIGYTPKVNLEAGIEITLGWIKNNYVGREGQ